MPTNGQCGQWKAAADSMSNQARQGTADCLLHTACPVQQVHLLQATHPTAPAASESPL